MQFVLFCSSIFIQTLGDCQVDSKSSKKIIQNNLNTYPQKDLVTNIPQKLELFNSGFIDFQNSGQMNASARVFKLFIGDPKKFSLPISVYSGVSGNNINTGNATHKGSEQMVLGLINPLGGIFNLSIDNITSLTRKKKLLTYHLLIK